MKNKIKLLSLCIVIFVMVTGCAKVKDLTPEQNAIIAEYAAGVMLKYSNVYKEKYEDLSDGFISNVPDEFETETETESETETDDEEETTTNSGNTPGGSSSNGNDESESADNEWHIEKEIGLAPLRMEFESCIITKEYPDDEDALFTFSAEEGYSFLIMNFYLYNDTTSDVTINNYDKKPAIKAYINDNKPVYNYANLMMNDITNLKAVTVAAGEVYEGIIVYMVNDDILDDISSIKLSYNDHEFIVKK